MRKYTRIERPKDESLKDKLLFAAMKEFAEKGYLGASLADMANHHATSSALICYHFSTKEKLAQEVIDYLVKNVTLPKAIDPSTLTTADLYRAALKKFISDFVDLFLSKEEPQCYIGALYRHESANPHAKPGSLHDSLLWPIFLELEKLIAAGVADRDPVNIRFWALAVWNILLGYTLKDPERVSKYYPAGMPKELFRESAIEFIVNKVLSSLRFTPQSDGRRDD